MLSLTRSFGQPVRLRINGVDIWVMIVRRAEGGMQLIFEAPEEVDIMRDEALPLADRAAFHPKAHSWRHLIESRMGSGGVNYKGDKK